MTQRALVRVMVVASLGLGACAVVGDRRQADGGGFTCPVGETCSTRTPPTYFAGASIAPLAVPLGIPPVAVGGTQTIRALRTADIRDAYTEPFDARSSNTARLTIVSATPPDTVVRGVSTGDTQLRLVEPGTDTLLNRVTVRSVQARAVTVRGLIADDGTPVFLAGGRARVLVGVWDGEPDMGASQIVDESLTLTAGTTSVTRVAWDTFEFDVPAAGLAFTATAGGVTANVPAAIVSLVDDIRWSGSATIPVGATRTVCATALSAGRSVAGPSYVFELGAGLAQSTEPDAGVTILESPRPGCTRVAGVTPGTAQLTVTAAGFRSTHTVTVVTGSGGMITTLPAAQVVPGDRTR